MARTFFVGGNWKMNGSIESVEKLTASLVGTNFGSTEVVVSPPFLYLLDVQAKLAAAGKSKEVQVAAQNAYPKPSGAFTGEVSAAQLADAKIPWVILGHSERRTYFGETNEIVADKTKAAVEAGLKVILCIGETLDEREAGKVEAVVSAQLDAVAKTVPKEWASRIVIAYEPVWAIGTGKTATAQQAQDVHAFIRKWAADKLGTSEADAVRIIYGGSVNAGNAKELAERPDIDGFLAGGASLKPEFATICTANN